MKMEYQVVTLFIISVLNIFFSYFVLRGEKKAVEIFLSLVSFSVSVWALILAFFIMTQDLGRALIFANTYYIVAAAIPVLFLYFSLFFKTNRKFRFKYLLFIIPILTLIIFLFINKHTILLDVYKTSYGKTVTFDKFNYALYILYFIVYIFISYWNLFKSYLAVNTKLEKLQIKYVLVGTSIPYALGMVLNLFYPWFGNYKYIWLGPVFTLAMVIVIGYAVIKHHLFNVKVIATELLTLTLWIFILIRTIIAESVQEQIINAVLLTVSIILGTFLIRSVIKEVEQREHIEKLAKDLEKANFRLKELDKLKSEFLSMATHQLRSPLASIKGYASLILEKSFGQVPPAINTAVDRIFQSSNNLVVVVEDFLNVSRIEQGRMKYEYSVFDISKIANDVMEELKPTVTKRGLEISFSADNDAGYKIKADVGKTRQVLTNIIDNAVKYTPTGSIYVSVSKGDTSGTVKVSIKDTGVGLPKKSIEQLFKKFSRAEGANQINISGTGLGLYVAKQMIEAQGGRIWAESDGEGKGSTFSFELPVVGNTPNA